jgi:hypothetical protein
MPSGIAFNLDFHHVLCEPRGGLVYGGHSGAVVILACVEDKYNVSRG